MIIDSRVHTSLIKEHFDLCIVGAGAAGITLALEICEKRTGKVALLESGGLHFNKFAQNQFAGEVAGDPHPSLYRTRYAGVGGSTELWAGWCRPLDKSDFEARPWIADSGWPIGFSDLKYHYLKATLWCGLGEKGYEADEWSALFDGRSLQENSDLRDRLFRVRRMSFKREYQKQLEESKNLTLFTHATTTRLFVGDNHERIDSVGLRLGNGDSAVLKARVFVLASGGLENPRLLLLSGDSPEQSIGNQHGMVGRYYNEHGFVDSGWFHTTSEGYRLSRYFPIPHPQGREFGTARHALTLDEKRLASEKLNNAALYFHPPYEAHEAFDRKSVKAALELWQMAKKQAIAGDLKTLLMDIASGPQHLPVAAYRKAFAGKQIPRQWRLRCYFECAPESSNRIELGEDKDALGRARLRVNWSLGQKDLASVERFHELVDHELRKNKIGHLSFPQGADEWRQRTETGKHLMGATRMHASSSGGVVNENCLVHGIRNLYIVGSSVFPTGGYANPTLTIVALSIRLAEHLADSGHFHD